MSSLHYVNAQGLTIEHLERLRDNVDTSCVHRSIIEAIALKMGYQAMIEQMRLGPYNCDTFSCLGRFGGASGHIS